MTENNSSRFFLDTRYLPDLHLTCELSKFEVKISFEILQLSPTSLKFAATLDPILV